MGSVKAFDINGVAITQGDLVRIVERPEVKHDRLKVGNTLRVAYWEDRTLADTEYICVFLHTKEGERVCSIGVQDKRLEVIEGNKG